MRRLFTTLVKVVLIVAVVLTVLLAVVSSLTGLNLPDMLVKGVLTPIRTGASHLTQGAQRIYNYMFSYEALESENQKLKELVASQLKADVPNIEIGSTVKVHVRIKEGEKERIQIFEGTVIAKNNSGISETFTVRRVSYGVGVERVFPVHSPIVAKVELVRRGRVRRAKLYYLRDRVGKAAKVKELIG